ncbi:MAG: glycosyltransferase family 4 protein [Patescibacteria group bacterium]|nr:glycosyltransferase family 4 protein [Patescibacteria group bacterium]
MLKSNKQILMVTRPICLPWNEASKNFAYELARRIKGNTFHLLTYKNLPEKKANIKEHPIYTSPDLQLSLKQKLRLLKFLARLPAGIDILHFLFTPSPLTTAILKRTVLPMARAGKSNHFSTIQTVATLNFLKMNSNNWKTYLFADKIVTHSDYSKNLLLKLGVPNVTCIKPGIDLQKFKPRPKNKLTLKKLGIAEEEKVILYTGEYVRLRAMDTIIASLPQLVKKYPTLKLILACRLKSHEDSVKKKEVQKKIAELGLTNKVIFLETFPKMEQLYNLADIFIFPVKEMTGKFDLALTVLEAMASGLPVIISDIQPLIETVQRPNSALTLTSTTKAPRELTLKILEVLQNNKLANKLKVRARKNAESFFDIRECTKQYEQLYATIKTAHPRLKQ